ncbi:MAG: hypothetical protein R3A80_05520 [Bdellovibrionota bacterium]
MSKNFLILFILISISISSPVHSIEQEELAQKISNSLMGSVENRAQPFNAYHYASREADLHVSSSESISKNKVFIEKHIKDWSEWFSNPHQKVTSGKDAQGLYAALEPLSSRNWGREDWVLFRIKMTKGMRLLDLSNPSVTWNLDKFAFELFNYCPRGTARSYFLSPYPQKCRLLFLKVIELLKVDVILYGYWRSAQFPGVCETVLDRSMLILKSDKLDLRDVEVFTSQGIMSDHEEEARVITELSRMNSIDRMSYKEGDPHYEGFWSNDDALEADRSIVQSYVNKNILGCLKKE